MKIKIFFFCLIFTQLFFAQNQWEILNPKPSFGNNKAIAFSKNVGYIINNSKELLSTSDNGKTWLVKQTVTSANDIKFSSNVGYIVGDNGYVLKSTDFGGNWSAVNIASSENLNSVTIFSDKIIISSATKIYSSIDGINWSSMSVNIPNPSVSKSIFTNSLEGHIYSLGKIYKTTDGGISWLNTFTYSSIPNDLNLLYFKNKNEGYINFGHNNFYKTTDAGQNWSLVPGNFLYAIKSIYFTDDNYGYAVGEYGNIYKTTDNGTSWTNYPESYFADNQKDLNSVFFTSQGEGFAVGNNGIILKTIDSGISWLKYSFSYDSIGKLQLVNGFYYLQVGNDIYESSDKIIWQKLKTPTVPNVYFNLIDFQVINDNKIYALVGTGGSSFFTKSIDGGQTWIVNENSNEGSGVLQFFNENTGYRTGSKMQKTTDGGNTWVTISGPYMHDVRFITESVAFGIKDNQLYKTSDGGVIWNVISGTEYVANYQFFDSNNGIVLDNYSVLKTKDGGVTFEKSATNNSYQYINFQNVNIGFLSGQYSNDHSYTDNGGATWKSLSKPFSDGSRKVINRDFYIGGGYGKFAKTILSYDNVYLLVKSVNVISGQKATVLGYGSLNSGDLENIQFEYSKDNSFSTIISGDSAPNLVSESTNSNLSNTINSLSPATNYFVRLKGINNGNSYYSNVLQFKTKDAYSESLTFDKTKSTSLLLKTIISSNDDNGLQNVEIIYGTQADNLNKTLAITPNSVSPNEVQTAYTLLSDLQKNTIYYFKIKFTYNGVETLGKLYTGKTLNGPSLLLYPYRISTGKFTGFIRADDSLTNIEFQYGTQNFENSITSSPTTIDEGTSISVASVSTPNTIEGLTYYTRIKAIQNGEVIFSNVELYTVNSPVVIAKSNEEIISDSSIKINGLISTNGYTASNLKLYYGLSSDILTESIDVNPNSITNYQTESITAVLTGLEFDKTYYYEYTTYNNIFNSTYSSDLYSFSLSKLKTGEIVINKTLIYPNPVGERLFVKSNELIKSLEIYDLQGRVVKKIKADPTNNFDVSGLKSGIYLISIELKSGKLINQKIIKK